MAETATDKGAWPGLLRSASGCCRPCCCYCCCCRRRPPARFPVPPAAPRPSQHSPQVPPGPRMRLPRLSGPPGLRWASPSLAALGGASPRSPQRAGGCRERSPSRSGVRMQAPQLGAAAAGSEPRALASCRPSGASRPAPQRRASLPSPSKPSGASAGPARRVVAAAVLLRGPRGCGLLEPQHPLLELVEVCDSLGLEVPPEDHARDAVVDVQAPALRGQDAPHCCSRRRGGVPPGGRLYCGQCLRGPEGPCLRSSPSPCPHKSAAWLTCQIKRNATVSALARQLHARPEGDTKAAKRRIIGD